ncbi:DEAD/DEAH box helicase [Microvirga massiliensis]|uniref:DEAD/DEAH box helicase n=1 Tax=Microvirga massiliensis TaxID=1033741 RepID=UPI00062B8FCA|nr:DEAD/DEAH box helicase [Microvirga massiliensis]
MTTFSDFGLVAPLQKALATEGYTTPTPIQIKAIPDAMAGRDLLGIAQTGTGKTAAFALPILHRLAQAPAPRQPKRCRVLVLSPTRELASQIADSFCAYGRNLRLTTTVVFGGVPIGRQERALASGVDILVATPGRLLDLVDRRSLDLRELEILVLDEADQMLDLGFIHDLKRIVRLIPAKRQSLFFSATMPKSIAALADEYLTDPVKVAVTPVATTAERVDQHVLFVPTARKQALLQAVLQDPAIERTLVFTRTKHGADRVVRHLLAAGIEAAAIHGNKSQNQRERALSAFRDGGCRVLVATDIAARGIDVEGVTHVINFELPNVPESYVHRIGRTARAGAAGIAISFCNDEERAYLRDIEKLTRLKVPVMPAPAGLDLVAVEPQQGNPSVEREPRRDARRPQQPQKQQSKRQLSARHNEAPQQRQSRDGRHKANGGHRNDSHASRGEAHPAMKRGAAQRSDRGGHAENGGNSIAWLARSR